MPVPQVDAKLAEELLREELTDQQTQTAATLRTALQEQQHQLEGMQADLKHRVGELQAAMKALDAQVESKVREVIILSTAAQHMP
jgi:Skp family chaperone for outer membrane proteins